jgi:hypothetical protein
MTKDYVAALLAYYPDSGKFLSTLYDRYTNKELELLGTKIEFINWQSLPPLSLLEDLIHGIYEFNPKKEGTLASFLINYENLPLMINHENSIVRKIVAWRLEIGK